MDDEVAIKVERISKKYCRSIRRSMLYGVKDIGRNILGMSSHSENLRKDEFWALDDVSFEVKKGEILGIIGPNGSGKTTLLKLLNGIFWPDKGKITVKGKVGALIEVGAGFHPLLTGRENVYINAAILGMTKKEIDERFDSIVEFADIGDFIDTPVKFYSSGMFVRLGFSVAVHCEPDILLVDEVLAVGDISFQFKCFNKIGELSSNNTTIVLVSHNLISIRRHCEKCTWLKSGKVIKIGNSSEVCDMYQIKVVDNFRKKKDLDYYPGYYPGTGAVIKDVLFLNSKMEVCNVFNPDEPVLIRVLISPKTKVINPNFEIKLKSVMGIEIMHIVKPLKEFFLPGSKKSILMKFEYIPLQNDVVYTNILIWDENMNRVLDRVAGKYHFRIGAARGLHGQLRLNYDISVE